MRLFLNLNHNHMPYQIQYKENTILIFQLNLKCLNPIFYVLRKVFQIYSKQLFYYNLLKRRIFSCVNIIFFYHLCNNKFLVFQLSNH